MFTPKRYKRPHTWEGEVGLDLLKEKPDGEIFIEYVLVAEPGTVTYDPSEDCWIVRIKAPR